MNGFFANRTHLEGPRPALVAVVSLAKALVVDDTVHRGNEIRKVKERINAAGLGQRVVYACVYVAPQSQDKVDYWFELVPPPRVFEWNLMHHSFLEDSCMDIDGVLCRDPSPEENDDGPRYREFVANVEHYATKEQRIAAGSHATFKAKACVHADALLFVESDRDQAREIAGLSGRPVFCFSTREMINSR
jgi:orotate phosphoribosyltransferase